MAILYVGNLPYALTEEDVASLFAPHGEVRSVRLAHHPRTGRSRGFAFVDVGDDEAAARAITALDGSALDGRRLRVHEARPRGPRRLRSFPR